MPGLIACSHEGAVDGSRQTGFGMEPIHRCQHPAHSHIRRVECVVCPDFYLRPPPQAQITGPQRHPLGLIVDRYDRPVPLADLYLGAQAFLLLGGPTVKSLPLEKLARRGVLLIAVNNCPAALPCGIRPHVWLHTDPTGKFHDSIWRDPGVLKFSPVKEWRSVNEKKKRGVRHRVDGKLMLANPRMAVDMPGVVGFHRNTRYAPQPKAGEALPTPLDGWLWEPTVNRGNDEESATGMKKGKKVGEANGWPKTINTMFAAIRLAFYLGVKTLYLVGADFRMPKDGDPYAFPQAKSKSGVQSNNSAYLDMCCMFDGLKPHFDAAGFQVYNTNPESHLWSFPFISFDEAIERATGSFEQTLNTEGWYDD